MAVPSVVVDLRKGFVYVLSQYSPGPGTYVTSNSIQKCTSHDTGLIGRAILEELGKFFEGGEIPKWETFRSPVLDVAGVSTRQEYNRGTRSCVVFLEGDRLDIGGDYGRFAVSQNSPDTLIGEVALAALGTTRDRQLRVHGLPDSHGDSGGKI